MSYFTDTVRSPLGLLLIEATDSGLTRLVFVDNAPESLISNEITHYAKKELDQYFAGSLQVFTTPLAPTGTAFQQSVWKSLSTIPFGESVSYQDIANSINNPKAVRAVGAANGKNPIAIIVPCHRVIGKNGSLTGYAWGVEVKAWLLQHEKMYK